MKTTIDRLGRLSLPEVLRRQLGLVTGIVEIEVRGDALLIRQCGALEFSDLELVDGIPTLPRTGVVTTDDEVRKMR